MYDIKDFVEAPNEKILKYNKDMKFDCIVSNAPYDNGLHEKFESKYFELCKGEIVWVSPLSFLLGKKQNKRITLELDKYKTDIEQINGNEYFDAAIGGTMGIVFCDMNKDEYNEHYVKFDGKEYEKCEEIRSYSNDELLVSIKNKIGCDNLIDNFMSHLKSVPGAKDQIQKYENNPNKNWWIYRIKAFSGQSTARSKEIGEFYALTSKQDTYESCCGLYKDFEAKKDRTGKQYLTYYMILPSEQCLHNFWGYIHTDFVNIILYCYKTGLNLFRGALDVIPWQDFTQEWNDEKLFKKYGITKEEIQHIYDILPNYYGIERINLDTYEL